VHPVVTRETLQPFFRNLKDALWVCCVRECDEFRIRYLVSRISLAVMGWVGCLVDSWMDLLWWDVIETGTVENGIVHRNLRSVLVRSCSLLGTAAKGMNSSPAVAETVFSV